MSNLSPIIQKIVKQAEKEFPWISDTLIIWIIDKLQDVEGETIALRSDLARAIGRMQGLGYPDKYLEKRYPELSHLKSGEEKCICHCHPENQLCHDESHPNGKFGKCKHCKSE